MSRDTNIRMLVGMSREDQNAIFEAWLDCHAEHYIGGGSWVMVGDDALCKLEAYRIAARPSEMDWSQISDEWICAATDRSGDSYFFTREPEKRCSFWGGVRQMRADVFTAFKPGNMLWNESLIWRPGCEPKS
jgi:hypothetical protein